MRANRMWRRFGAVCLGALLLTPGPGRTETPLALGVSAGTTGVGLELHAGVSERLNLRLGYSYFDGGHDVDAEDSNGVPNDELRYRGDLQLHNLGLIADWYPWSGSFHVSAGAVYNNNDLKVEARCDNPSGCEVGDSNFSRTDIGTIFTDVDINPFGPYLGIGWGNPFAGESGLHWNFEVGAIYQGEPDIEMTSNGSCGGFLAVCRAALEQEEQELEDELDDLVLYPVIKLGLSYRFD